MNKNKQKRYIVFVILVTILMIVFAFYIREYISKNIHKDKILKVAFLNVGQGDAIYIQAPNGKQTLIDGGRDRKVISELSRVMPFGDKSIDVVIGTHPDADHIGGLYYLLKTYKVSVFFEPGATSTSNIYKSLQDTITDKKIPHMIARKGRSIILDKENNVVLEILYPDKNPIGWDSNDASVITMLSYGNTRVLLTGDSSVEKELYLVKEDPSNPSGQVSMLKANILKLGHHGSRTSSAKEFLEKVDPDISIISAGRNNSYGHPHPEVIALLNSLGLKYLETSKEGTIVCESDALVFVCK